MEATYNIWIEINIYNIGLDQLLCKKMMMLPSFFHMLKVNIDTTCDHQDMPSIQFDSRHDVNAFFE